MSVTLVSLVMVAFTVHQAVSTHGTPMRGSSLGKVKDLILDLIKTTYKEQKQADMDIHAEREMCAEGKTETEKELASQLTMCKMNRAKKDKSESKLSGCKNRFNECTQEKAQKEAELEKAKKLRAQETKDFKEADKNLESIIESLEKAIIILQRQTRGSLAQMKNMDSITHAFDVMVQGSMLSAADAGRLTALVQNSQASEQASEDDQDLSFAPAAAVYTRKSGSIIDILRDLKEKALSERQDGRKHEMTAQHAFDLLKQDIESEIKENEKCLKMQGECVKECGGDIKDATMVIKMCEHAIAVAKKKQGKK